MAHPLSAVCSVEHTSLARTHSMEIHEPNYRTILDKVNQLHRSIDEIEGRTPRAAYLSVDREGSREEDVAALERRLGVRLPFSYRLFLLQVNGCERLGLAHGGLWRVEQLKWFREDNQAWIDAYMKDDGDEVSADDHLVYGSGQFSYQFRRAYLPELLQIGEVFDGSVHLLNPCVKEAASGEWEAWDFANWYPGAYRIRTFLDMVEEKASQLESQLMFLKRP